MLATRKDFSVDEGRDVVLVFTIAADDGETLDGSTVEWQVSRHVGSSEVLILKSIGAGIELPSEDLVFEVSLTGEDTAGMDGKFYHEALVINANGDRVKTTYGYMTVVPSLIGETSA